MLLEAERGGPAESQAAAPANTMRALTLLPLLALAALCLTGQAGKHYHFSPKPHPRTGCLGGDPATLPLLPLSAYNPFYSLTTLLLLGLICLPSALIWWRRGRVGGPAG